MSREPIRFRNSLTIKRCLKIVLWGISRRFHRLFPRNGQVAHALRTLAPVAINTSTNLRVMLPLDLHVLSKPKDALYIFSSFDERAILTMKRLHPDAECALITGAPMSKELIEHLKELGFSRVACAVHGTSFKAMEAAHKEGIIVNLWPGKKIEDFQRAVALGADIACTDIPVKVLKFAKKHMPWVTPAKDLK